VNTDRLAKLLAFAGAGFMAVGALMLYRQRRGSLHGLTLGRGPLITERVAQAPVVDGFSAGGMKTELRQSRSMSIQQRLATIQDLVHKSVQDPRMRKLALDITSKCPARDGTCEAQAVYDAVKQRVRYTGDIAPIKQGANGEVDGIDLYQAAYRTWEFKGGDCLPAGTMLLTEGHKFVPIEDLIIGSRIWGRDAWTTVEDVWAKGTLPVDAVHLNNGSTFMATGDHKVYVAICPRHPYDRPSGPCACPIAERAVERITVTQLRPGMTLVQPERIAFGTETEDPRRALIEGYYLADGWKSHASDFDIAGRDGHPKEAQKAEVAALCAELGIETTMFEKSIRIRDKAWAERVAGMGDRAPIKQALSINLTEEGAAALLRGIMADSGTNTNGGGRTFTTTSRALARQVRVLERMFGRSCSERYLENHGGLGEHPIHRLGVRDEARSDGRATKLLRVKEIDRAIAERPVYDITTSDHYVYLPDADVVVSNCDDHSILISTLLALNGIEPRLRVTAESVSADWGHIYPAAILPKGTSGKPVALDTTLPERIAKFGYEVPYAKNLDFPA
jgi:hypothetical protein